MADVETRESYLDFINRYAGRMVTEAADARQPHPRFSERYRAADDAWRELHPDSEFGDEFKSLPERTSEPVPEPAPVAVDPVEIKECPAPGYRHPAGRSLVAEIAMALRGFAEGVRDAFLGDRGRG